MRFLLALLLAAGCDAGLSAGRVERCALGVRVQEDGGSLADALVAFEDMIGRPVDLDRQFYLLDHEAPGAHERWVSDGGRTPLISIASRLTIGERVPWSEVADPASARATALVDDLAARLRDFDRPILVIFHPEPEEDPELGSPEEYVAAWRRVVEAARAAGADNATWVWALGSGAFPTEADPWYPGDDWVDWIGVSGFNTFGTDDTRWRTFPSIFAPFREWALPRGRPLLIVSSASGENPYVEPDDPRSKATWIREALSQLESWPEVQGFVWFNGFGPDDEGRWLVDSTPEALAAFRELGAAPHFDITGAAPID
jgi:hypothetical protein